MFAIQSSGRLATEGQKVFRYKSPFRKAVTTFIPERGMITIRHNPGEGEDEYSRCSIEEFKARARALAAEIKHCKYGDERRELQACVMAMVQAIRAANDQGDPFNAVHVDQALADYRRSQRSKGLILPSSVIGAPPRPMAELSAAIRTAKSAATPPAP